MYCKNCGTLLPDNASVCENCNTAVNDNELSTIVVSATTGETNIPTQSINPKIKVAKEKGLEIVNKYNVVIMIILGILTLTCLIIAITQLTSSNYSYCVQQYNECLDGYKDTSATANSGGFLSSSYRSIANSYKDLMDSWSKRIWGIRIKAIISIICSLASAVFLYFSYKQFRKNKNMNSK